MTQRNLLFLDLETSGLDPFTHEVLEVAAILTDPTGREVLGRYEARVPMLNLAAASAEALRLNGYSEARWKNARPHDEVAWEFYALAAGVTLVGQNISFDEAFLRAFLRQRIGVNPPWHYHKLDTASLAYPWFAAGRIPSLSLSDVAPFFGVTNPAEHRAMSDAETARQVFLAITAILDERLFWGKR